MGSTVRVGPVRIPRLFPYCNREGAVVVLQVACQSGAWGLSSSSGGCVVVVVIVPMAARTFGTSISPHGDVVAPCQVMRLRAAWRRWSEVQRRVKAPGERSEPGARAAGASAPPAVLRLGSLLVGHAAPAQWAMTTSLAAKTRRLAG